MWTNPRDRHGDCNDSESSEEKKILVNIGGVKQVLSSYLLSRYPETRLAELASCSSKSLDYISCLCDDYDPVNGEFYFDRDPETFKCIVDVYYNGEIHMKHGACPICFKKELEFWRVDPEYLDECCKTHLNEMEDELAEIAAKVKLILDDLNSDPSLSRWQKSKIFLWKLMEKPESSLQARVIAILSFLFILISSVVMCMGTIPELQVEDAEGNPVEHPTLEVIETACICWFTVEYLLRLISSPNKLHFVLSFMNIIDFMAIIPFYVVLTLTSLGTAMMELANVQQAVQALRIMRIARIFKLARHSSGLQTLTYALKRSFKELGLLLLYMGIGIFVFSALGYTMEQSHPENMFSSIPQSFWWAIITMTTVGYGDIYPKTTLGRCNAAISFLCGVIAIALPIHPIINNFVIFYNKQKVLETAAKHELELLALQANEDALKKSSRKVHKTGGVLAVWDGPMRASNSDTHLLLQEEPAQGTPLRNSVDSSTQL
ncbi:potassium voltage-gated channel subfamily F member 1-like [Scleropages formosus]|uniref:potassium voltage-gated channel subfamily F member 1-like n=1 Tax=Scleropages formosus TaxID=113540 RepID=UPI0010FA71C7|nr:potassium voltage-gated channel subfamily F member 1-like [Scleropages formosus]